LASSGITNGDLNPPMRAALSRVRGADSLSLAVGQGELVLSRARGDRVIERKVPLPMRWLKGLLEVQAYQARMKPRLSLSPVEASRFLRSLPRRSSPRQATWLVRSGTALRLAQRPERDGLPARAVERWRALEPLAHAARSVRVFQDDAGQACAWALEGLGHGFSEGKGSRGGCVPRPGG
jgi:hypothetical protein